MKYLSSHIEALTKKKKTEEKSLIKKQYSCGIFQDYEVNESSTIESRT